MINGNLSPSSDITKQNRVIEITVDTPADTVNKIANIPGYNLIKGDIFAITFINGNTASSPTLKINDGNDIPIVLSGGNPTGSANTGAIYSIENGVLLVYYNGINFCLFGSQDATDADTTSITSLFGSSASQYIVHNPTVLPNSVGVYYPFIGICDDNTIEKITGTSSSIDPGSRNFTSQKISLLNNILFVLGSSNNWVPDRSLTLQCYSRFIINSRWKYSIGEYYNLSGVLVPNTDDTDLNNSIVYIGGTRDGNYFIPSEYSLTCRDTNLVYKRIGYFTPKGSFYLTDYQLNYIYNGTEWVEFIGENIPYPYTYIVDSDQKLNDWASNVGGNNYTNVFIAPGTWTLQSEGINLENIGTKSVTGASGSIITLVPYQSGTTTGLYDGVFSQSQAYNSQLSNITVKLVGGSWIADGVFKGCNNLNNCIVLVPESGIVNAGNTTLVCFSNCTYLRGCKVLSDLMDIFAISRSTGAITGFLDSSSLTDCFVGLGVSQSFTNIIGFSQCKEINNPSITISVEESGVTTTMGLTGFSACDKIINAKINFSAYPPISGTGNFRGFSSCNQILNSDCIIYCNNDSTGYNQCSQIHTSNIDILLSTESSYGFNNCTGVISCKSSAQVNYSNSYPTLDSSGITCDQSAAGGFNY